MLNLPSPTEPLTRFLASLFSPLEKNDSALQHPDFLSDHGPDSPTETTTIPSQFLSTPLSFNHRFLSPTPGSAEYYQLSPSEETSQLYTSLCQSISQTQRDRIDQELDSLLDLIHVKNPGWNVEAEDGVRVRYPIGDNGLGVTLRWEEQAPFTSSGFGSTVREAQDPRPCWTFHTLDTLNNTSNPTHFYPTLQDAIEAFEQKGQLQELESINKERHTINPNRDQTESKSKKAVELMAEGEGTTPGAYGSAEDFWANWDDDEKHVMEKQASTNATYLDNNKNISDDDEGYWDGYGQVESVVGEEDKEPPVEQLAVPPPPPRTIPVPVKTITRSRRSSTIRAPLSPLASRGASPVRPISQTNGHTKPHNTEELLHQTLKGLWGMFSANAEGSDLERKKQIWDQLTSQVKDSM